MVKSSVCSAGIHKMGKRKLVKRAQTLENLRVYDLPLMRVTVNESVDRIPNL